MRIVSAFAVLDVAAAAAFIAVDRSCPDGRTGCNGGCYQWKDDADYFKNCMQGKSTAANAIMKDLVVIESSKECAELGFTPLTKFADGSPFPSGSTAPDKCYGGDGTRVSFFATDQDWFWETVIPQGVDPTVDCPQWQAQNPQCFDHTVTQAMAKGPCSQYFGPVSTPDGDKLLVTVVDPDLGITAVSESYCDSIGHSYPCTFIHYAGLHTKCISPGTPDGCHRYIKVTYDNGAADTLKQLNMTGSLDASDAFITEGANIGAHKDLVKHVVKTETHCFSPPADEPVACKCPTAITV